MFSSIQKKIKAPVMALMFMLVTALCVSANAPVVQARTVTAGKSVKKAKAVKKGKTTVRFANHNMKGGYVKFKAPKTGKYVFICSDLKTSKRDRQTGYDTGTVTFAAGPKKWGNIYQKYLKSEFGKTMYAELATADCMNHLPEYRGSRYRTVRSLTAKIKKGQVYYIHIADGGLSGTLLLTVRKK